MNRICPALPVLMSAMLMPWCLRAAEKEIPRAIPVMRFHLNPLELTELSVRHKELWGPEGPESELLSIDLLNGEQSQPGWQVMQQLDLLENTPGYLQEMVLPRHARITQEMLQQDEMRDVSLTMDEDHLVICGLSEGAIEDLDTDPGVHQVTYREQLATTLDYLKWRPLRRGLRIEFLPSKLLRTNARGQIRGLLASAATMGQRRDHEATSEHAMRAAGLQLTTDAARLLLSDAERLTVELGRGDLAGEIEFQVSVGAVKDSRLHQLFTQLGRGRNRSLSWLHPAHTGFLTVSLPCPDNVAMTLGQRGHLQGITDELGEVFWPLEFLPVARLADSDREDGKLELLAQTILCSDGSSALIWIWPCRNDRTDAIRQVSWLQPSSRKMAGHPVLQGREFELGGKSVRLTVVRTEQCVGAVVGTDAASDMLEEILARDFEETATTRRLARSVLAADLPLDHPVICEALGLRELLPSDPEVESPETRLTMECEFDGTESVITLHCQKHASAIGMAVTDASLEALNVVFEFVMDQ